MAINIIILILFLAMDLDFQHFPEADDITQNYCKPIKGDSSDCYVCMMENPVWEKYQLVCGHKYHTRCYRKWVATTHKLSCSVCGDIPQIRQNAFCCLCNGFYDHNVNQCASLHGLADAVTEKVKYRYCQNSSYLKPTVLRTKIYKKDK